MAEGGADGNPDGGTAAGGMLIVIGARGPDEAAARLDAAGAPPAALLVEPDPDRAAAIEARLAGRPGVRVIQAAVGAAGGEAALTVWNLPGVSSLAPAAGLAALFPGLRALAHPRVPVLSVAALMAQAGAGAAAGPLWIAIDAGGAEGAILDGLAALGLMDRIERIDLRVGVEPLFAGALTLAEAEARLIAQGFVRAGLDAADPDWPELRMIPDRIRRERDALAAALDAARAEAAAQARALAEAKAEAEARGKALAEARAAVEARDKALAEAKAAAEAQRKALETARAEGAAQAKALAETEAKLAHKTALVEARDKALAEAKAEAEARGRRIVEIEARERTLAETLKAREAALAKAAAQAGEAGEEARRLALDLRAAQRDLGLALRMQAALQADLADLQERHAAAVAARDRQDDLLRQLVPRLQEAARQLQALPPAPPPDPVPALAGKAGKKGAGKGGRKTAR